MVPNGVWRSALRVGIANIVGVAWREDLDTLAQKSFSPGAGSFNHHGAIREIREIRVIVVHPVDASTGEPHLLA